MPMSTWTVTATGQQLVPDRCQVSALTHQMNHIQPLLRHLRRVAEFDALDLHPPGENNMTSSPGA